MPASNILDDIHLELELFFDDLNWTFIFMFLMILYGIKHKYEFEWYDKMFRTRWWDSAKTWIAGFLVASFFCLFQWLRPEPFTSEYVAQLLRSWFIVMIFNSIYTKNKMDFDK